LFEGVSSINERNVKRGIFSRKLAAAIRRPTNKRARLLPGLLYDG
jgi:hypothetical protein